MNDTTNDTNPTSNTKVNGSSQLTAELTMENAANKNDHCLDIEHFTQMPNILINDLKDDKIKARDLFVYAVYASHKGKNKTAWPGNKLVAAMVGTSVRNLGRCLTRLKEAGHISRQGRAAFGTRHTFLNTRVENNKVINCGKHAKPEQLDVPREKFTMTAEEFDRLNPRPSDRYPIDMPVSAPSKVDKKEKARPRDLIDRMEEEQERLNNEGSEYVPF